MTRGSLESARSRGLCRANLVPVGADQLPRVGQARRLAAEPPRPVARQPLADLANAMHTDY